MKSIDDIPINDPRALRAVLEFCPSASKVKFVEEEAIEEEAEDDEAEEDEVIVEQKVVQQEAVEEEVSSSSSLALEEILKAWSNVRFII